MSSVNRKQGEFVVNLPREFESLESKIREMVSKRVSRGRVSVRVTIHTLEDTDVAQPRLNLQLAKACVAELRRAGGSLGISGEPTLETLVRLPGVLKIEAGIDNPESVWPAVRGALAEALKGLEGMRSHEGANLEKDLKKRIANLTKSVKRIKRHAPNVMKRYREQLLDRLDKANLDSIDPFDERILKEVILFADRSDISEELARLESHFEQFETCIASKGPVGRTLDFLAQELNREINTVGSKANDSLISREVVQLKTELEKFREQVQNAE